jgi:hypothetical protein
VTREDRDLVVMRRVLGQPSATDLFALVRSQGKPCKAVLEAVTRELVARIDVVLEEGRPHDVRELGQPVTPLAYSRLLS